MVHIEALGNLQAQELIHWTGSADTQQVTCRVESRHDTSRFAWAFVALSALPEHFVSSKAAGLNLTYQLETQNNQVNLSELLQHDNLPGLVMCRAQNEFGWQLEPCATLLVAPNHSGKLPVQMLKL